MFGTGIEPTRIADQKNPAELASAVSDIANQSRQPGDFGGLMLVAHSQLMNEFIAFWFETSMNGVVRFETFIDFVGHEWYTCHVGEVAPVLLRGMFEFSLSEDAMIAHVKSLVEAAVSSGHI